MNRNYFYKTLAVFSVSLILVYTGFVASHFWQKQSIDLSMPKTDEKAYYSTINFIKPNYNPAEKNKHLTRVEIEVKDDLQSPNGKIASVVFNDDQLFLNPADQYGKRGSTFMQLLPGIYSIEWSVKNNPHTWPRESKFTSQIEVKTDDLWIHIFIEGNRITKT